MLTNVGSTEKHVYDHRLESDLRELLRIAKERRLLELADKLWHVHAPPNCVGQCAAPSKIGTMGLTCCNFFVFHEKYEQAHALELLQREAVEQGRDRQHAARQRRVIEGGPLAEKYYRDFTGTWVARQGKNPEDD